LKYNLFEKMRNFIFLVLTTVSVHLLAANGDTIFVKTHTDVHIETNPSVGNTKYPAWAKFPDASKTFNKVILKLTFQCPTGENCGEWDYLNYIYLRRTGGVSGVSKDIEISRYITPYGNSYTSTWKGDWLLDLTDFEGLLRDSVEIEYIHTGYETNNGRGWKINLEFQMIEGTPIREFIKVNELWNGQFSYGNANNPFDNQVTEKTVVLSNETQSTRLRLMQSGHSFDQYEGCAEFCSKLRTVKFDNAIVETKPVWRDNCGLNPTYPQAGTWIYDRGGWCPGDNVLPDAYDFTVMPGTSHSWDIDMQAFTNQDAAQNPNYVFAGYLIEYKAPNFTLDASIEQVLSPSQHFEHRRFNPICANPEIIIKNNGTTPLTKLTIIYGEKDGTKSTYVWTGNLGFLKSEKVTLTEKVIWTKSQGDFEFEILNPNDGADEYSFNNKAYAKFVAPPSYEPNFIVVYKSNNAPGETQVYIKDENGNAVYSRTTATANQVYNDTVNLSVGCYVLEVIDSDKDGINFWANNDGSGYIRFKRNGGPQVLRSFGADFGTSIIHHFTIGGTINVDEQKLNDIDINIYPNPSEGIFNFNINGEFTESVTLTIYDATGKVVFEKRGIKNNLYSENLSHLATGVYNAMITNSKIVATKKFVKK